MQVIEARAVFDSPRFNPEGQYGPYYSMMIELPEGAPGAQYDQQYDRHYAYMSFDADYEGVDDLLALDRGDPLQVIWNGKKYKPTSSGVTTTSSSQPTSRAPGPAKSVEQMPRHLVQLGLKRLAMDTAELALAVYEEVSGDERASDLNADERLRVALSGVIQANRDASRELSAAVERARREVIESADPDNLPTSLLNAIASLLPDMYESGGEVAEYLKLLGFSSADIDPADKDNWYEMYEIAKSAPLEDEVEEEEAEEDGGEVPF